MLRTQDRIAGETLMGNQGNPRVETFVLADGAQTIQLKPGETGLVIISGNAANTVTVTLPPVHQAAGQIVFINARAGATAATTVEDYNDDAGLSDLTLDADDDHVLLYSTGERWLTLVNGIV